MNNSTNIIVTVCAFSTVAIAYGLFRYLKRRVKLTNELDGKEIQYINELSLKSVVEWIDNISDQSLNGYDKLRVNILPNLATKETFKDQMPLPQKDQNKAILIVIIDDNSKKVVKRKLVIPVSISDDLVALKKNKIFEIPVDL